WVYQDQVRVTLFELASRDALCSGLRRLGEHLARHA
ncbi:hypothetical protein PSYJA_45986, partial [Pseudomonas syringae pv. japonica str. M301072]